MTRIVAGTLGGRRLVVPRGETTRPTSERVREALFSALEARGVISGARVVDLYAGSGALGLEALSRGAASVILVDSSRRAVEAARRNVQELGLSRVSVVLSAVGAFLARPPKLPADLVFADPPYAAKEDDVAAMLAALAAQWLQPGAVVVVERSSRSLEPRWPAPLVRADVRRYGETALWQAQHRPD
jgi:16S rRNA (guanine966-N2)-methyltransferase